ncbi:hypothetical protein B0J14DRAFT_638384 [Halenospora varia]|nr:hypothetical protein B0J14DRAFT_638384 [Halenospora varia]
MEDHISRLSDEVLALIAYQVLESDSGMASVLCRVSRKFYRLAIPNLYQRTSLTPFKLERLYIDTGPHTETMKIDMCSYTRNLTIGGKRQEKWNWGHLQDLLVAIKQLKDLHWTYWGEPIPLSILDTLKQQRPDLALHIEELYIGHKDSEQPRQLYTGGQIVALGCQSPASIQHQLDLEVQSPFFGCQNVHSIKVNINYDDLATKRKLKDLARSCLNLETFHIRVLQEDGTIAYHRPDPYVPLDFGVEARDKLPPVRELIYESRWNGGGGQWVGQRGFIPCSFFNWTRIQHLELRGVMMWRFMRSIQGQISHLETLKVENFCWYEDCIEASQVLNEFLSDIQGLVTLELINPTDFIWKHVLMQQGKSLEHFSYFPPRKCSSPFGQVNTDELSARDLPEFASACPNISSMTLQLMIGSDLPYDYLFALAQFPNLESLRLYTRFDDLTSFDSEHRCLLESDRSTVTYIATYLRDNKLGKPLSTIEIVLGEWAKNEPAGEYSYGYASIYSHERPDIIFTCYFDAKKRVVLEDDSWSVTDPAWEGYLDREGLSDVPGRTYPAGLSTRLGAGEEADRIFAKADAMKDEDDDGSLFGDDYILQS